MMKRNVAETRGTASHSDKDWQAQEEEEEDITNTEMTSLEEEYLDEEVIVLLEENGKPVLGSPSKNGHCNRRGRRGRVLSSISKAAAKAAQATRNQQQQCCNSSFSRLCFRLFVLLVFIIVVIKASTWFHTAKNESIEGLQGPDKAKQQDKSSTEKPAKTKPSIKDATSSSSSSASEQKSDMEQAYDFALQRFEKRIKMNSKNDGTSKVSSFHGYINLLESPNHPTHPTRNQRLLNTIRIPMAGDVALSTTARSIVGCSYDGFPCCIDSCPTSEYVCPYVTGCEGKHRPTFSKGNEPIITSVSDPSSRLVTGFFDFPPHRPNLEEGHSWKIFKESYIKRPKYRNIMTKIFNEDLPYKNYHHSEYNVETAKQNVCRLSWYAITEFPILSSLMLYETKEFSMLQPNPISFGLTPLSESTTKSTTTMTEKGNNILTSNNEYQHFKTTTFVRRNGTELVQQYNQEDYELYDFFKQLFCARVESMQGLISDIATSISKTTNVRSELKDCRTIIKNISKRQKKDKIREKDLCL